MCPSHSSISRRSTSWCATLAKASDGIIAGTGSDEYSAMISRATSLSAYIRWISLHRFRSPICHEVPGRTWDRHRKKPGSSELRHCASHGQVAFETIPELLKRSHECVPETFRDTNGEHHKEALRIARRKSSASMIASSTSAVPVGGSIV